MADLTAGTVVGWRYEIERVLARGGMSTVYIARDKKFDVRIALKVAGSQGPSTAEMIRERFKREAKLANVLGREQQFVRVFDWGEVDGAPGQLFLAMDLVEGATELDLANGTMHERLGRVNEAMRVVSSLHRLGVIHRDLKPSNFLRARDGSLRLTDFGIAKQLGDPEDSAARDMATAMGLTGTGMAMGTPFYMPPEQFEDAKSADARADVYALGVMLFNALAGRLPFTGDNASQVLSTQMRVRYEGRPPPRPRDHVNTLPLALDQVAAKAIALDAAQRYPSVDEMIVALEKSGWQNLVPGFEGPRAGAGRANAATRIETPRSGPGPADAPTEAFAPTEPAGGAQRDTTAGPGSNRASTATAGVRAPSTGSGPRPAPPPAGKPPRGTGRPGADDATLSTAPAPPVPPVRPRDEMGRGVVQSDGVQIPKVVWFVVGTLLVVGLGINLLPKLQTSPLTQPHLPISGLEPTTQPTTPPVRPEATVALEDLPDSHRNELAQAERLHAAWKAKTGASEATVEELLGAEGAGEFNAELEGARVSRVTREGKEVAVTEADSRRYRYVLEGDAPPRIFRR